MSDHRKDVERMHRVSDMLLTAHSHRRDKLSFWASSLEMSTLGLSILSLAFVFAEPSQVGTRAYIDTLLTVLPWIGIFVFLLTVVQLKYDLRGNSALHGKAVGTLAGLKSELNALLKSNDAGLEQDYERMRRYYDLSMNSIPPIKERDFLKFKALHKKKVQISKILDEYPNANIWMLNMKLWFHDNWRKAPESDHD